MSNIIETIVGDINEKRLYRDTEKRAKQLPAPYAKAYKEIRNYIWQTSGITTIQPLVSLVELLEEAAADSRSVTDVTGPDVAYFADELVKDAASWKAAQREALNRKFKK